MVVDSPLFRQRAKAFFFIKNGVPWGSSPSFLCVNCTSRVLSMILNFNFFTAAGGLEISRKPTAGQKLPQPCSPPPFSLRLTEGVSKPSCLSWVFPNPLTAPSRKRLFLVMRLTLVYVRSSLVHVAWNYYSRTTARAVGITWFRNKRRSDPGRTREPPVVTAPAGESAPGVTSEGAGTQPLWGGYIPRPPGDA